MSAGHTVAACGIGLLIVLLLMGIGWSAGEDQVRRAELHPVCELWAEEHGDTLFVARHVAPCREHLIELMATPEAP